MSTETLEEQVGDFYWAADSIRQHQQTVGSAEKPDWDGMSHALWILLALHRNAENPKLQSRVHDFLVQEVGIPGHLVCQLAMLAPAAAVPAEAAFG